MNIYRNPYQTHPQCHLIIGNFDGVHLGHQQLIKTARAEASKDGCPLACLTFEPHPKTFFNLPHTPIQTLYDKLITLKAYGIDQIYVVKFNQAMATLMPTDFIETILMPLRPKCIHVGVDFNFGKDRLGNSETLKQHFEVNNISLRETEGEKYASTSCRELLQQGDLTALAKQLGRPYHISGIVQKGQQLGRQLGYPTANLHAISHPLAGIYAATTILPDRRFIPSAVSIGYRPFKPIDHGLLESHLIDFNEDLYGKRLFVVFHKKIRSQATFNQTEALVKQMDDDLQNIKTFFSQRSPI